MNSPLFSVILPTKDRAELALAVIRHTLRQSFRDFELIVVDNGDSGTIFQSASDLGDNRIKFVRTGGLNMPDNWQAGIDHAEGKYLLMIEDKLFLTFDCLEQCAAIIRAKNHPLITWMMGVCKGEHCSTLAPTGMPSTQTLQSEEFFRYGSHCMLDHYQKRAPRGINMLVERSFAKQVEAKAGRLCRAMSPDYSLGALLLPFTPDFIHVNAVFGRVLENGPSNGEQLSRRTTAARAFWSSLGLTDEELLHFVPLKIVTLHNLMVSDLFRFWRAAGISESQLKLDWKGYFLMMFYDCVLMQKQGIEFSKERREIRKSFTNRTLLEKADFFRYAISRFSKGWPNRKLRMRENLPEVIRTLKIIAAN